jgi:hypothetical protein
MKRRDFLKGLAALAAAPVAMKLVPLLPAVAAETEANVVYETYSMEWLKDDLSDIIYHIDPDIDVMRAALRRDKTIMGVTPNGNVWSFFPTETPILVGPEEEKNG